MKIKVTVEDIEGARRRDPNNCPVARALRRLGVAHVGVTGMLVMLDAGRKHTPVLLPGAVQEWILDFDWGMDVSPFEFELNLPQAPEPIEVTAKNEEPAPAAEEEAVVEAPAARCSSRKRSVLPRATRRGNRMPGFLPRTLSRSAGRRQEHPENEPELVV